jgi:corrinoid protein of di/trimethylamine methyltransferase
MNKHEIISGLARAVVEMDTETVERLAYLSLEAGIPAQEGIENGLSKGMERVGELFAGGEYFVPEVVVCADTLYAGLNILKPAMPKDVKAKGRIVIGVVAGDTHDIGKNIVAMMLEADGFEIIDLGRNVPLPEFGRKALELDADIIALSSLMTTTMMGMQSVVEDVKEKFPDKKRYVMVGGAPLSQAFAQRIGADGYAPDASRAVKLARRFMGLEG